MTALTPGQKAFGRRSVFSKPKQTSVQRKALVERAEKRRADEIEANRRRLKAEFTERQARRGGGA